MPKELPMSSSSERMESRALTLVAPGGRRRWVRLVPTSSSSAWSQPPLPFFLSYVRHLTRCDWELARAVVTSSLQGGARISEARDASLLLMLEEIRRSLVGGAAVPPAQSMLPVSASLPATRSRSPARISSPRPSTALCSSTCTRSSMPSSSTAPGSPTSHSTSTG